MTNALFKNAYLMKIKDIVKKCTQWSNNLNNTNDYK